MLAPGGAEAEAVLLAVPRKLQKQWYGRHEPALPHTMCWADDSAACAVKTLVLHMSLAHRDWLPPGQLPPGHALTVQHTLHMLLGAGLGPCGQRVADCAKGMLAYLSAHAAGWRNAYGRSLDGPWCLISVVPAPGMIRASCLLLWRQIATTCSLTPCMRICCCRCC